MALREESDGVRVVVAFDDSSELGHQWPLPVVDRWSAAITSNFFLATAEGAAACNVAGRPTLDA